MLFTGIFKVIEIFINFIVKYLINGVINSVISVFATCVTLILNLLPTSPFLFLEKKSFVDFISKINYFIPFYEFVVIMESWLVCISVFYLHSIWARWVKAIE